MWRKLMLAGLLLPFAVPALAQEAVSPAELISCAPARADVAKAALENVRFGATETFYWATGKVRLTLWNRTEQVYSLKGRAVPNHRPLARNKAPAAFAYPGFRCVVDTPFITAVRNCTAGGRNRACDVTLDIWDTTYAFTVTVTADREKPPARTAAVP